MFRRLIVVLGFFFACQQGKSESSFKGTLVWSVNGVTQEPRVNEVQGVNTEHMFAIGPQGDWTMQTNSPDFTLDLVNPDRIISEDTYARMSRAEVYATYREPRTLPLSGIARRRFVLEKTNQEAPFRSGTYTLLSKADGKCAILILKIDAIFATNDRSFHVLAEEQIRECL
ncbi:MAG: hypothetical protein K8S54_18710 [Spirochaetia bacterium]|nr:hypothetical protein [Spirochaetia bacterium]